MSSLVNGSDGNAQTRAVASTEPQDIQDHDVRPYSNPSETLAVDQTVHLSKIATNQDESHATSQLQRTVTTASAAGPVYSVFSKNQKRFIIFMASWAGFFSPISGTIYYPALNPLAADLNVSNTLINLTLTSYMIFQGLAPSFFGDFSDAAGRRPAYAICFSIYIAANIGLALQNSFPALFILRCIQSTGSSATIAMCSAVVADIATPAERGTYMGVAYSGSLLGPAIGPVIGGLLADFVGWRAIFWFLLALGAAFMIVFGVFLPETARTQVGNGSIPPKGWNMSLINILAMRKSRQLDPKETSERVEDEAALPRKKVTFPNPLRSVSVIFDKANALLLFYNGFIFAAFYAVSAVIPSQFAEIYHFNEFQIGLCYIPCGAGAMTAVLVNGRILDGNFSRWCKKLGIKIRKGRDQDLSNFPIEKVRLQIGIPAAYASVAFTCIFGWLIHVDGPLAAVLVVLFFTNFAISVSYNVTTTLLVDLYPKSPATAGAANNLVRCLLGAGFTAAVIPLVNAIGRGWTFTAFSVFLFITSPMLWLLYFRGMDLRADRHRRQEQKKILKEEGKILATGGEGGGAHESRQAGGELPQGPVEVKIEQGSTDIHR
ncbi:hypothetical protein PV10_03742 [Exophiala mesophila]|uniref:Major facilitator superfamily (MFS) profile domain-containing protein n=1 Tax=Exophiala mesophila TaxID=212818 RepID=A0A0D1WTB4_EXOME|nr:uncharacterized protein PV10_03742 [Exophiala mesophila]KIV92445.1 hypothetical protein PV10_03742 [Exophiala mesophila]